MDIYFLQADNGLIKISITNNIKQRLETLSEDNASHLKFLGSIVGNFQMESDIHKEFANERSHGDWFKSSEKLLTFINKYANKNPDLKIKEKIKKPSKKDICLDDWEKQIIYGALLGNSFIVEPSKGLHCYMVIRQSRKTDLNIFLYKTAELKAFSRQSPVYSDSNDYRWTSISHPDFDDIKSFCYTNNNKNVTMDWLNVLKDVSLMVWYLDKGFYTDGVLGINISNLSKFKDTIHQYFNEVGMPCSLKGNKIVFDEKGRDTFLRIIGHRVPKVLHYRLLGDK